VNFLKEFKETKLPVLRKNNRASKMDNFVFLNFLREFKGIKLPILGRNFISD
jgi:hypothetical protein